MRIEEIPDLLVSQPVQLKATQVVLSTFLLVSPRRLRMMEVTSRSAVANQRQLVLLAAYAFSLPMVLEPMDLRVAWTYSVVVLPKDSLAISEYNLDQQGPVYLEASKSPLD